LDQRTLELISNSAIQTKRIGAQLADLLEGGEVIGLEGDLGTGKTCLVQGLANGLGVDGPVTSPTFTLIQEYVLAAGPVRTLYHVDLYRLTRPVEETFGIGLDELLEQPDGVVAIEWADRISSALPDERLWVSMQFFDETKRLIRIYGQGGRYHSLVRRFRERMIGTSLPRV
jgi:tRNA threonylcarbamoyladenosine biosynthesis protein TsaE